MKKSLLKVSTREYDDTKTERTIWEFLLPVWYFVIKPPEDRTITIERKPHNEKHTEDTRTPTARS